MAEMTTAQKTGYKISSKIFVRTAALDTLH